MIQARLDPWIEGYLSYLGEVKRLTKETVKDNRCAFKRMSEAAEKIKPGVPLWKLQLMDYMQWVNQEREGGASESNISKNISHIRCLLDYAWRSGKSDRNVLDGFNIADRRNNVEPRSLTLEEAKLIVKVCGKKTFLERRDRLIILMFYGCGLRTGELRRLLVSDIDIEKQEIFIRHAKGDKERRVPVPSGVWTELLAYLMERDCKRGPVFRTSQKKKLLGIAELGDIVSSIAQRAGISGRITPKVLRHSFASHLMDQGVDIAVISTLMGHRSPSETGIYLHVLPGRKNEATGVIMKDVEVKS